MKSMLVIGAGRFGKHLSISLARMGNEVMIVDKDEERVSSLAPFVTDAEIADCQDFDTLNALGVSNFDVCFVCISGNFQSSLEITSLLKDAGAKRVVSKTDTDKQGIFLDKIGADELINAEKEMAHRIAAKYSAKNVYDYIEISPDYAIVETLVPKKWHGHTVQDIAVRKKYNVNILGYKDNKKGLIPLMSPDHLFQEDEHIVIAGLVNDIENITKKT